MAEIRNKIAGKTAGKKTGVPLKQKTWRDKLIRLARKPEDLYDYLEELIDENMEKLEKYLAYVVLNRLVSNAVLLDYFVNLAPLDDCLMDFIQEQFLSTDLRGFFEGIPVAERQAAVDEYNGVFGEAEEFSL